MWHMLILFLTRSRMRCSIPPLMPDKVLLKKRLQLDVAFYILFITYSKVAAGHSLE